MTDFWQASSLFPRTVDYVRYILLSFATNSLFCKAEHINRKTNCLFYFGVKETNHNI